MKQFAKAFFRSVGLDVRKVQATPDFVMPVEFSKRDIEVFQHVWENKLTMGLPQGLTAAIIACKHAVAAETPGDFVECGVWRGGLSLAAKMIFEEYGSDKKAWLFDTFTGMPEPSEFDRPKFEEFDTRQVFQAGQRNGFNQWCYASLEDVRSSFERAGVDMAGVRFIKGDVRSTLLDTSNLPETISVLRLDTDWYESTKVQLEALYPRLSTRGALLIDDFGYWEGVRKAVEEYFSTLPRTSRPLLYYTDLSGRMGVKV
jgi:O-methyltransferase